MSSAAGTGTGGRRKAPPPPARKSSGGQQQGYDELKLKFLTADRNYENLKQLARKGKDVTGSRKYNNCCFDHRCYLRVCFDVASQLACLSTHACFNMNSC